MTVGWCHSSVITALVAQALTPSNFYFISCYQTHSYLQLRQNALKQKMGGRLYTDIQVMDYETRDEIHFSELTIFTYPTAENDVHH